MPARKWALTLSSVPTHRAVESAEDGGRRKGKGGSTKPPARQQENHGQRSLGFAFSIIAARA